MTPEEVIHDLEVIRDDFINRCNGCAPMCFDEAIRIIKEVKEADNEHL